MPAATLPETMPSPPPSAASWKPAAPIAPPPGEVFRLPPLSAPPLALPLRPAARRLLRAAGGDPFALTTPTPLGPATGQVFALHEELAAAPKASAPEPQDPAPRPPLAFVRRQPAPEEAPRQVGPLLPSEAAPPPPSPLASVEPLPEAVPEPVPTLVAGSEPAPWWRGSSGEATGPSAAPAASAAPPPSAARQAPAAVPSPAAATPLARLEGAIGVEVQASGALPSPELRPSDPGTATLGELYLRQGHLGEARNIFHQVLERDPDNEVALRGLEAIGRRRGTSLSAAELVGGDEPDVRGVTSRKILLLERYLEQLRAGNRDQRGAGSDVPGATE
jgi:hypothetical protein